LGDYLIHSPRHRYQKIRWSDVYKLIKQNRYLEALDSIYGIDKEIHITAVRKIHGPIAKLCDKIIELSNEGRLEEHITELIQGIVKSIIIVRYQIARKLIDKELGETVIRGLQDLYNTLISKDKYKQARDQASKLRIFIDSVIAYKYKK